MALTFRFGGNVHAASVDLEDWRVRLPMPALTERAEGMTIGTSQITFDDPDGTFTVPGLRGFRANEDDCTSSVRLYTGFLADRTIRHGDAEHSSLVTGAARIWTVSLYDFNHDASRVILRGGAANRPAETDVERINWYVGSGFSVNVGDYGLIDTANPVDLPPTNYDGRFALDLVQDCMNASGKNGFIYYPASAGADDLTNALAYFFATSSMYTSTLSFTSVLGEADDDTIFYVSKTPVEVLDPSRVYSGIYIRFTGGSVWGTNQDTYDNFYQKETTIDEPDITSAAAANTLLAKYLADAADEEVSVTFTVRLPSTHVNLITQGMRTAVHFPQLPGYEDGAYVRVVARTVQQATKAGTPLGGLYDVTLECRDPKFIGALGTGTKPPPAGGGGPFPGGAAHWYSGTFSFMSDGDGMADSGAAFETGQTYTWHVEITLADTGDYGGAFGLGTAPVAIPLPAWWSVNEGTPTGGGGPTVGTMTPSAWDDTGAATYTFDGSFTIPSGGAGSLAASPQTAYFMASQAAESHVPHAVTVSFWFDPAGWVTTNAPQPGQLIEHETPTPATDGTTTTFTTAWPYLAGSLRVYVDLLDQTSAVTSFDPAAGTFTLAYAPTASEQLTVSYQAA